MKLPPAAVLATFPIPNYVNPETHGPALTIVNSVFLGFATVAIVLRIYTRLFVRKWFGWDDAFIILAYICTVGVNIATALGTTKYGWNRHIWDIPLSMGQSAQKLAYGTKLIFLCAGFFTAASLLAFYYRLARESTLRWFKWSLHAAAVFNVVAWLPFLFAQIFVCVPIYAFWTFPEPKGTTCMNEAPVTMAGGIVKVVVDLVITTIPIPLIMHLKMERRQKYGIIVLLCLGYFVAAAGAVRVYYTWRVFYTTYDMTWFQSYAFIASAIENDVAIIVACLPTLRPLLPHLMGGPVGVLRSRMKDWTTRSKSSSAASKNTSNVERTLQSKTGIESESQLGLVPSESDGLPKVGKLIIHTSQSFELEENVVNGKV